MISITNYEEAGLMAAIRGMRNSFKSGHLSDSQDFGDGVVIGMSDGTLMRRLFKAGKSERKFMRMIVMYMDINAPLYWWKQFDTYKVGTVTNSESTMHTITDKPFTIDDFSCDDMNEMSRASLIYVINTLNALRDSYLAAKMVENSIGDLSASQSKKIFDSIIKLLPESYNQKRTVMMNYEVMADIWKDRRFHKLSEWKELCSFIEKTASNSWIFTGK